MDKEVRDALIRKCRALLDDKKETHMRISDVHDLLLRNGVPFNILYRAYHVQEGRYLFYDHSEPLTQLLNKFLVIAKWSESRPIEMVEARRRYLEEQVNRRCFRVSKVTGNIDVYDYDNGVVLFERKETND